MHLSTSCALLSLSALSAAQIAREPPRGIVFPPNIRPYYPTGTGAVLPYRTGVPSGGFVPGAVNTQTVFTTNIVVTDCGDGTMIYQAKPTEVVKPGQMHFVNTTTIIPSPTTRPEAPYLTTPEAFTGEAVSHARPHGLTPYLSTIAGLALAALFA